MFKGKEMQITEIEAPVYNSTLNGTKEAPFGSLFVDDRVYIKCAGPALLPVLKLKPANRREMKAADFIHGLKAGGKVFEQGKYRFET
jgi:methionyl-tRNA formyltransferase